MEDIHIILISFIDKESNTTDGHIAEVIFNHLNQLEDVSISELAELCNVSKSAITRFCRHIGLEGLFELRYLIKKYQKRARDKFVIDGVDSKTLSHQAYIDLQLQELANFKTLYQEDKVKKLAQWLNSYSQIVLMGNLQSNAAAFLLQATLLQLDIISQVITSPQKQKEFLETSREDCLILIFSLSGIFITRYQYARHEKTKLVLLTNNPTPPNQEFYDLILCMGTRADYSTDHVPLTLMTNLIALACYQLQ